ncbi:hypothetical protein NITMOv2_4434 [Nitrospira moscoviensis]|uniref:Uncharacterized protein n=1 Tax=Nitrospira moscoviensis TaxID=42253 RepID=A0A0K2GIM1_NITMO|nr:hypothetical protein NITMOv2_4434 [Nitrospira moscoviensis]
MTSDGFPVERTDKGDEHLSGFIEEIDGALFDKKSHALSQEELCFQVLRRILTQYRDSGRTLYWNDALLPPRCCSE